MSSNFRGSLDPMRANGEYVTHVATFDIGASGAHTKEYGSGMSVARNAAGKYTITFSEWGPVLMDLKVTHYAQADASGLHCRPTDGTFATTATSATVDYEAWDLATPTQTEIPSGDRVCITAVFKKTA